MTDRTALCDELTATWHREIPIVAAMGMAVEHYDGASLSVRAPMQPNRNVHGTTFAGSLYTACVLTGMNYRLTAIPQDFPSTAASTDFDPVEMTRMFDEGVRQATCGTAWRSTPPGLEAGEHVSQRGGVNLTVVPTGPRPATGPPEPPGLFDLRRPVTR